MTIEYEHMYTNSQIQDNGGRHNHLAYYIGLSTIATPAQLRPIVMKDDSMLHESDFGQYTSTDERLDEPSSPPTTYKSPSTAITPIKVHERVKDSIQ